MSLATRNSIAMPRSDQRKALRIVLREEVCTFVHARGEKQYQTMILLPHKHLMSALHHGPSASNDEMCESIISQSHSSSSTQREEMCTFSYARDRQTAKLQCVPSQRTRCTHCTAFIVHRSENAVCDHPALPIFFGPGFV